MSLKNVILAAAVSLASCAPNREIVRLNDRSFRENVIGSNNPTIIEFYTEWCPACKISKPVYRKVAGEYRHLNFSDYDCDSGNLCRELEIIGVPTYSIFRNGTEIARSIGYLGEAGLKEFINSQLGGM